MWTQVQEVTIELSNLESEHIHLDSLFWHEQDLVFGTKSLSRTVHSCTQNYFGSGGNTCGSSALTPLQGLVEGPLVCWTILAGEFFSV